MVAFQFSADIFAQQEAMYTHYMYNTLAVNPAYAGSREALTITALHRSQWVGFDGAPQTQTLTIHSPVIKDAVNLGLSMINDKIGPVNNAGIFIDYAFRFKLSEESNLALGLKVGVNEYSFNLSALKAKDILDNQITESGNSLLPNVGVGIYYSRERFYLGLSTPKLFENQYDYNDYVTENELNKEKLHYYLISGGLIDLNRNVKLKPTGFLKVTQGAPIEMDISAEFFYEEKYSMGLMYRSGDSVGLLLGMALTKHLNLGYSFDWSFVNKTAKYNAGSHEVVLQYEFSRKKKGMFDAIKSFCKF
jgi:type IX secretion system PorP/SprF family membrane protein